MATTLKTTTDNHSVPAYAHHGTSTQTSTAAHGRSVYVFDPTLGSKANDPIVQGYHLSFPVDQHEPEGRPEAGGFTWQQPAGDGRLWGVSAPSINDINQGTLGDCYFDAALGAVVNSP